ncbi:MAG: 23S rRNA (uracil(1939)-C(5))-methyltransferase RlmD [Cyanophyceae cyanobacterium]
MTAIDLAPQSSPQWQQGALVDLSIDDLTDGGDGVGRWQDRPVFVPDTVPGDRVRVRLVFIKPRFGRGVVVELLEPSRDRVRPPCIVADKCGGCQWQPVSYEAQLAAKERQAIEALRRIGGFAEPPVAPILAAPSPLNYRNKVTYPIAAGPDGQVRAGYYRKGSHKLVNLNRCPIQDERFDSLLSYFKDEIQDLDWQPYDEETHTGQIRHISFRIGRRTGEMLVTLVSREPELPELEVRSRRWLDEVPNLVGVFLNVNPQRGNRIFGEDTYIVAGREYILERLGDLEFRMGPDTFFQVYTEQAEAMIAAIAAQLDLKGHETVVDAYCGVGTLALPLAKRAARVIGIEVQGPALDWAQFNARRNDLNNTKFHEGTVEEKLPEILAGLAAADAPADMVVLDPPRRGCQPEVIAALREALPQRIVYMSCKPATLARDLERLCADGLYQLVMVQPADFFPQTPHVECAAFLERSP